MNNFKKDKNPGNIIYLELPYLGQLVQLERSQERPPVDQQH